MARFLQIGMGSAGGLEYFGLLARDLGLLEADVYTQLTQDVVEVKRMLAPFINKLKADR